MPTFKHPCPYCGKFIDGGAVACPFCGVTEPFTRGRCPDCRAILEPGWLACPKCGRTLTSVDAISPAAIGTTGAAMATPKPPPPPPAATPPAAVPPPVATASKCSGCGAPLPAGARFCEECGTLVS